MNVTDALATSPNTAFAKLISQVGRAALRRHGGKAGLRSYALPGTARDYDPDSNESLADFVKRQNLGSFTLGPIEVNALELSNVAATLASGGMWCPPNPIDKVVDRNGKEVAVTTETCEQVVPEGLANTLANAMSKDDTGRGHGRRRGGLGRAGTCRCPARPAPPRRTARRHSSASPTRWPRPTTSTTTRRAPGELCSFPLRQCGSGNLFGGNEPARTWFTAMKPIANNFGEVDAAADRPALCRRRARLAGAQRGGPDPGHRPAAAQGGRLPGRRPGHPGQQQRAVRRCGRDLPDWSDGARLDHHDPDLQRHPAGTASAAARRDPRAAAATGVGQTVVEIPGLPPITVPVLGPPPPRAPTAAVIGL